MTDVRTPNRGQRAGQQDTRGGRRGMLFSGETEARPGIMTTEFWLTLLAAATLVIRPQRSRPGTRGPASPRRSKPRSEALMSSPAAPTHASRSSAASG